MHGRLRLIAAARPVAAASPAHCCRDASWLPAATILQYLVEETQSNNATVVNRMSVRLGRDHINAAPSLAAGGTTLTVDALYFSGLPLVWSPPAGWVTDFETPGNLTIVPGSGARAVPV